MRRVSFRSHDAMRIHCDRYTNSTLGSGSIRIPQRKSFTFSKSKTEINANKIVKLTFYQACNRLTTLTWGVLQYN